MSFFVELFKYIRSFFGKQGTCDITIVRRYPTPTGLIGELYVDGRQYAVTCDRFIGTTELFKHPLTVEFSQGRRVLSTGVYSITNGDFTAKVSVDDCLVGSMEPSENKATLGRLLDVVQNKEHIRLTVLNRLLIEN